MSWQISWSSPEEDSLCTLNKKQWRKFRSIGAQKQATHSSTPEKMCVITNNFNKKCSEEVIVSNPCVLSDLEESPVIGMMKLSTSPLINESCISTSPIIGKKRKRRLLKACKESPIHESTLNTIAKSEFKRKIPSTFDQKFEILRCKKSTKIDSQLSPDIFSEASPNIEVNESPHDKTQYIISQVNSQNSSIVIDSSTISPQSKASLESLYYQVPEKNKKRYKRGGLASEVQKHLKSERANVAIWKHESYLCKNGEYSLSPIDENLILSVKIQKVWNEFESTYVLCCNSNDDELIMLINSEYVDVNKLQIGTFYKIYPPYSEHIIPYNNKNMKCVVNITRLKKFDVI